MLIYANYFLYYTTYSFSDMYIIGSDKTKDASYFIVQFISEYLIPIKLQQTSFHYVSLFASINLFYPEL